MNINGVLLFYYLPLTQDASTILENVKALEAHSKFRVWRVNTFLGFPKSLADLRFSVLAFHYSIFGNWPFSISPDFLSYVSQNQSAYKVAFFQDEYQFCPERFEFINQNRIDSVYTLVEPEHFAAVYGRYTSARKITHHLTGYVSPDLIELAQRLSVPDADRAIDVSYRARPLPEYLGLGAQEKTGIADEFRRRAVGLGLRLDIETSEEKRIYGQDWYRFLAQSRACLGVEAGVSVFDLEGQVRQARDFLAADSTSSDAAERYQEVLAAWEDRIFYRTISPRHFECAAFRVAQILFEGRYTGILQPEKHYIPLKKDFSNFDDCLRMFQDTGLRQELTNRAYHDLIASGEFSYRKFIAGFDEELADAGLEASMSEAQAKAVTNGLGRDRMMLELRARKNRLMYHKNFPGRRVLSLIGGPPLRMLRRLKQTFATARSPYLKEKN